MEIVLQSRDDSSVNFIFTGNYVGKIEVRYVRRKKWYIVAYLSSQTGCEQACKMCHLTAMKETRLVDVTPQQFVEQAKTVLQWYDHHEARADVVNFNFMARGEALVNPYLLSDSNSILSELQRLARERSLIPQFNISTIMPKTLAGKKLKDIFPGIQPEIYYSIYSVDEDFRKRWLPKSLPVEESLKMLVDWQEFSGKIPKIHFAFIENENDSIESVVAICDTINAAGLKVNVNIVRYNPFSERQGTEPSEEIIERNMHVMQELLPNARINLIKKVGFDVQASCGMFAK